MSYDIYRKQVLTWTTKHAYAFRTEPFMLRSGVPSHHYLDFRPMLLAPGHQRLIAHVVALLAAHSGIKFDGVAGVPLGGLLLADAVAFETPCSMAVPREEAKEHGTKRKVEVGLGLEKGARLLLLEDVVTSGGSAIRAATALREAGFVVEDAIAILNRQTGGDAFAEVGVRLHAVFTLQDILAAAGQV